MKSKKKESGFTLIEVVASIVIITIVLLSFSQLFIQSNKTVLDIAYRRYQIIKMSEYEETLAQYIS